MVLLDNIISLHVLDNVVIAEEKQIVIKIIEIKNTIKVELKKLLFMIKTSIELAFGKSEKVKSEELKTNRY